ncbi:MAG: hypothetical protein K1X83_03065 [Oligoflexia bacterium]|nr:hypothetical protein [Oligoflexia bacterium]
MNKPANPSPALTVSIESFSYRKGLPAPPTEHGGGFVFDCRCVPNPGREERFKALTGQNQAVADYLRERSEASAFELHCFALIEQAVSSYLERGFNSLEVAFGCTGGQHRSVYFAEKLAAKLQSVKNVTVKLSHRDMPR